MPSYLQSNSANQGCFYIFMYKKEPDIFCSYFICSIKYLAGTVQNMPGLPRCHNVIYPWTKCTWLAQFDLSWIGEGLGTLLVGHCSTGCPLLLSMLPYHHLKPWSQRLLFPYQADGQQEILKGLSFLRYSKVWYWVYFARLTYLMFSGVFLSFMMRKPSRLLLFPIWMMKPLPELKATQWLFPLLSVLLHWSFPFRIPLAMYWRVVTSAWWSIIKSSMSQPAITCPLNVQYKGWKDGRDTHCNKFFAWKYIIGKFTRKSWSQKAQCGSLRVICNSCETNVSKWYGLTSVCSCWIEIRIITRICRRDATLHRCLNGNCPFNIVHRVLYPKVFCWPVISSIMYTLNIRVS